jgi:hypothetical protein
VNRVRCATVCFLLAAGLVAARDQPPDPTAAALAEAKQAHQAAVTKAKDSLVQAFDRAEKALREDTALKAEQQLAQLRQLKQEREAFVKDGTLPGLVRMKTPAGEYRRAIAAADTHLDRAYDTAIRAYTKLGRDVVAGTLLGEKQRLALGAIDGPFRPGAVWQGHHVYRGLTYPAKLVVLSRDGEAFKGRLTWVYGTDPEASLLVEGKATAKSISFKSTKIERGQAIIFPVTYDGKVDGAVAIGAWAHTAPGGQARGEFRYSFAALP